jgi:hypothetical protein
MGIFKKVIRLAGYGGSQECKFCGKTRSVASSSTCMSREGRSKPHIWLKSKK